jgi:hypothetical protein
MILLNQENIMARTVYFIPKLTSAKTQYREIDPVDHTWLIGQMLEWTVKMATLSNTTHPDLRAVRNDYWRKRRATLPRGREGQNSPESMIAGILENMLYDPNPQRDFTQPQCDAIEDISNWMAALDSTRFEEVRFFIKVI